VPRRWKNTPDNWGTIARSFHWLIAVLVLGQLVIGKVADEMALSPQKLDLFVWHKSIGVSILLLALFRLLWRVGNAPPEPPPGIPRWETLFARTGHTLLYVLLFAVPISGWWISDSSRIPFKAFWIVPVPDWLPTDRATQELAEDVHGMLIIALLAVLAIHIAAALRHHFVLHNDTLRRMLPRRQPD
jgi:cytochrome b561